MAASFNSREVNFYRSPAQSQHIQRYGSEDSQSNLDEVPLMPSDTDSFETDEREYLMQPRWSRGMHRQGFFTRCSQAWTNFLARMADSCSNRCCGKKELRPRSVLIGRAQPPSQKFPANVIRNQKYSVFSFIPLVLFEQFRFFLNFYFLVMACSQFISEIRVGYLYTYWGPLVFVIMVAMIREAVDDFMRYRRDKEVNSQKYRKLTKRGPVSIASSDIHVGDLIYVDKDQRLPADMVFLRTTERSGTCFVRTDQMDGETDWKLRLAVTGTQALSTDDELFDIAAHVYAEAPRKEIYTFIGTFTRTDSSLTEDSLSLENTLWANTVVASGTCLGLVVYTGSETRSVMNTSKPSVKIGLIDEEINAMTKWLFFMMVLLSLLMMVLKGFSGPWYRYFIRFIVLFSYIIPISLRINLDMGKVWYAWMMAKDENIPDTVVRTTTIPEELGRIQYLLSDKTGTLTQNEMVFKRFHLGTVSFGPETMDEVSRHIKTAYQKDVSSKSSSRHLGKVRRTISTRVVEAVRAIALCHNVTPVQDDDEQSDQPEADQLEDQEVNYQASSPDEVALVRWTETVGLALIKRDLHGMTLRTPFTDFKNFSILQIFPFTSESKRMGIIVKEEETGQIYFYMKGADVVMQTIVQYNDWLEEECGNMGREGLRTLVVAKKPLSEEVYQDFEMRYHQAKMSVSDRSAKVAAVVESLERDMELLCLTGVEDKLQEGVRSTLELLRNASIKIWMLTGDKLETAICIAKSSRLVSPTQDIYVFKAVNSRSEAHLELNAFRRKCDDVLVIRGDSLEVCLKFYEHEFVELACQCPAVVVCRCSPTQKAEIVTLLKTHTHKRTCAIGDGGNDVSMIQAADAGVGIVGKEGKQASLAADFSITQFRYLSRLLLVHGRNSYKRTASMSQFLIHRGLIISTMQAVFSACFYFASLALFPGYLYIGYSTVYTSFPVFSLVLDKDVSSEIAMTFPELYKELTKGRSLSYKTFFMWILISIYQGGIIMFGAFILFEADFMHIVSITFTSLILTELLMIALTVRTWHYMMIVAEVISLAIYVVSLVVLRNYFDPDFLSSWGFIWKVVVITSVSCIPLYILKYLRKKFSPPSYSKLT